LYLFFNCPIVKKVESYYYYYIVFIRKTAKTTTEPTTGLTLTSPERKTRYDAAPPRSVINFIISILLLVLLLLLLFTYQYHVLLIHVFCVFHS